MATVSVTDVLRRPLRTLHEARQREINIGSRCRANYGDSNASYPSKVIYKYGSAMDGYTYGVKAEKDGEEWEVTSSQLTEHDYVELDPFVYDALRRPEKENDPRAVPMVTGPSRAAKTTDLPELGRPQFRLSADTSSAEEAIEEEDGAGR